MKQLFNMLYQEMEKHREPFCQHFRKCGGCSLQDLSYPKQIELKERFLEKIFDKKIIVIPSPVEKYYRGKMEYVYAFGKLGMREKGTYKFVVDLQECYLLSEKMRVFLPKLKALFEKYNITSHNYLNHQGYLRYAVIRHTKFKDEYMINLVTYTEDDRVKKVMEEIMQQYDALIWSVNSKLAETSIGHVREIWKKDNICEQFDNVKYQIGPYSFFQTNSFIAKEIYKKIKEYVFGNVLDLYAGAGNISMYIADKCNFITSVEFNEASVKMAHKNIELNGLTNIEIVRSMCYDFLKQNQHLEYDWVILDPPRTGLERTVKQISRLLPERIIYISCNAKTFLLDLDKLSDNYKLEEIIGYDMFPQTPHLELFSVLNRK